MTKFTHVICVCSLLVKPIRKTSKSTPCTSYPTFIILKVETIFFLINFRRYILPAALKQAPLKMLKYVEKFWKLTWSMKRSLAYNLRRTAFASPRVNIIKRRVLSTRIQNPRWLDSLTVTPPRWYIKFQLNFTQLIPPFEASFAHLVQRPDESANSGVKLYLMYVGNYLLYERRTRDHPYVGMLQRINRTENRFVLINDDFSAK